MIEIDDMDFGIIKKKEEFDNQQEKEFEIKEEENEKEDINKKKGKR